MSAAKKYLNYFKMFNFTSDMNKIKPGYFAGGLIIGIVIGLILHSLPVGIAIGVVIGTLITFQKSEGINTRLIYE
jgi:uncharacterized membrane protein